MSGHNKWSKIKHKKAIDDAKKSREFSKFARLISLESKKVTGNTSAPGLRSAILRAKSANMPSQNIERAIKKGVEKDATSLEEVVYEAYGPGGSALIIHGLTDNKNRTTAEIKHLLLQHSSSLAEAGTASWAFEKKEDCWIPKTTMQLEEKDGAQLSSLTKTLKAHDDVQEIFTNAL